MDTFLELSSQIAVGGITAVIASYLTVWLSLRRFYSEKWWEKKAEAYSTTLDALHYMKRFFDENLNAQMMHRGLPEDRNQDLNKKFHKAYDELKKRIDIGQFVLSDEAVAALSAFQTEYNKAKDAESLVEYFDESWGATEHALKQMRAIARADLKGR